MKRLMLPFFVCGLTLLADARPAGAVQSFPPGRQSPKKVKPADAVPVAWLGVAVAPVSEIVRKQLKLPQEGGLAVIFVAPEAPVLGVLQENDILLELDGQKLLSQPQFRQIVRSHKANDEVSLLICRDGQTQTVKAKVGIAPDAGRMEIGDEAEMVPFHLHPFHVELAEPRPGVVGGETQVAIASSIVENEDGYAYILRSSSDGKETTRTFTVKNLESGQIEFNGLVGSDEEKAKVPEKFRKAMERMVNSAGSLKAPSNIGFVGGNPPEAHPLPSLPIDEMIKAQERRLEEQRQRLEEMNRRLEEQVRRMNEELRRLSRMHEEDDAGEDEAEGPGKEGDAPPPPGKR